MKNILKMSLITLAVTMSASALANQFEGLTCAGKKTAIQTQLDYAKQANNVYQVQGLEKALTDVNTYCSNDDLAKKYQEKVQEKTAKLQEKQDDLKEAQLKGDPSKIAKQQAKLQKAQYELQEAQTQLDSFHQKLKAE
ncbi:uncharacterized protein DUF1090 [Orbus hercynius]|uniref:Uncharacterized protein DUF1090 n=1 Tax=Orbus hercynius TaxID=593135 RepID=A0A495RJM7_9GAMM|nr:DUF1090 domain-containing protein [Orbus hercynius]RKS86988.1 uncharacterized protein DUF1090 [Orbus hercynius]